MWVAHARWWLCAKANLGMHAGVELAASCTRVRGERATALMLITAAGGMALGNVAVGFLAGARSLAYLLFAPSIGPLVA